MQEESTLQSIPRNSGMKIVIALSINTKNQEALKIGNCSRGLSRPPKDYFSTSRSRRSPTRVVDLGNS